VDRGDHGGMEFGGKMGACSKDGVQHDWFSSVQSRRVDIKRAF